MQKLFGKMEEELKAGRDVALVTVTASSGSVPRGAGARMLVGSGGRLCGTIGGGAVEYMAIQRAAQVLETRSSYVENYRLREEQIRDIGMVCGGDVRVHFLCVGPDDKRILKVLEEVLGAYRSHREAWLVQKLGGETGGLSLCDTGGTIEGDPVPLAVCRRLSDRPVICEEEGETYYCDRLFEAGVVYIFGGGHVAQALVPVLASVDFRCVVLEDREEFCRKELFPRAEDVRMIRNDRIAEYVNIDARDYVCVMTRGHKDDTLIQAQVLRTPAAYVGVIGSRRKAAAVAERLRREWGVPEEDIQRIHTPIGLEIGAETPAEIAVSIAAELIRCRAGME